MTLAQLLGDYFYSHLKRRNHIFLVQSHYYRDST